MTKSRRSDQFMYLCLAAVLSVSALVIMMKVTGVDRETVVGLVEGITISKAESAQDMLDQVRAINDDGGKKEFNRLRQEAAGL